MQRDHTESLSSGQLGLEKECEMARKDYTAGQAIGRLPEAEARLSQGERIGQICWAPGICEPG